MKHKLQIRLIVKDFVQFDRTSPHGLICFTCQGCGFSLLNAQDIHTTIDHIGTFEAGITLNDTNRELGEDRVNCIHEHGQVVVGKHQLGIGSEGLHVDILNLQHTLADGQL